MVPPRPGLLDEGWCCLDEPLDNPFRLLPEQRRRWIYVDSGTAEERLVASWTPFFVRGIPPNRVAEEADT
ncbi:hypothetical protein S40285_10511 [Stachybotrys chlorohalonatus IBT 40285]|uniref:Uncharacterized protein n=1 Tax=Stachybotrys chlorohalonatus (strain IBT 40285) TaxID=1283841 RepID=A0A084QGI5_STAC4|nr:hypothetical protein S40285_10511 [Stachybotrys chlorohalonata IBT 40285]